MIYTALYRSVNCELLILGRLNESTGEVGHAPVFSIVLPESFEPFVKLAGVRGAREAPCYVPRACGPAGPWAPR